MYLKTRISRGIRYLTIMEAYWDKEAHRSKERVVCSLGREDQLDNKSGKNIGIKLLMLSGNGHLVSDILKIETENTLHWGITDIYRKIWDDYLLDEFLNVLIKNSIYSAIISHFFKISSNRPLKRAVMASLALIPNLEQVRR